MRLTNMNTSNNVKTNNQTETEDFEIDFNKCTKSELIEMVQNSFAESDYLREQNTALERKLNKILKDFIVFERELISEINDFE